MSSAAAIKLPGKRRRPQPEVPSLPEGAEESPKHALITEVMSRQIALGRWLPGSKLPTEAQLMARFNVSRITIRRALQDLMRDGLLVGRQGKGTYVNASKAARAINLLFVHGQESDATHPYTAHLLEGVRSFSQHASPTFRIELAAMKPVNLQSPDDTTIEELVTYGRHHGVIAMPRIHSRAMERMLERGVPIVLIGGTGPQAVPAGCVMVDIRRDPGDLELAMEHFRSIGCQRVGVLSGSHPKELERFIGRVRRIYPEFPVANWEVSGWGINAGAAAMERLLARVPDLDAVYAYEDLIALGAMHTLWKRGKRVPEDVAVLGTGNQLGEENHSGLSTIDIHLREMGYLAAQALHRMLQDLPVENETLINPTLVRRASTNR